LVANTQMNCGGAIQNYGLGSGLCAMMKVSNNAAANAVQEAIGSGNPQTGWNRMLSGAGSAAGLTDTSFGNRMGCGGPTNPQINLTTLRDLGRLFEQMATNPEVLFPATQPAGFVFSNSAAYNLMDNHTNEFIVAAILAEQAAEMGLDMATRNNFQSGVRLVHKTGSNCAGDQCTCPGGGRCPDFETIAGWISLPINGGTDSRDYVYGVFFNNVTANNSLGGSLREEAAEMLRPVIRDALENF
jgi:hypothetical protein